MRCAFRANSASCACEKVEYGHAHGDAVFHLIQDNRMLGVSNVAAQFHSSVDGTRVHDHNLPLQAVEESLIDTVVEGVFAQAREIPDLLPLELNAEHVGNVAPLQGLPYIQFNLYVESGNVLGEQGRWTAHHYFRAQLLQGKNVGKRHT